MIFFTCLMMAGGVFYWLKNETGPPPLPEKASVETEAFFAVTKEEGQGEVPSPDAPSSEAEWIFATEPLIVNINTADSAELEKLPGIGPAKAAAIIAYRNAHGPFTEVSELMRVPGIKEATFARLSAYVVI
ncbi:MAG: helix-hairpin-helix domain-containing protein [Lachnospiraceae bacterium]|nr:helix-hairpin-helix domain-containing protein [Lachnospiraceae bacterium]